MNELQVLGIPGSLRTGSYNRALLENARELAPADMSLEIFDLHDIPMFNTDVEAIAVPEPVMALRRAIGRADALLIATPEYNYSIPGVLKNAIDWASRTRPDAVSPLNGKPLAIIGAGGYLGTVRAQDHLRTILLHNDLKVLNRPVFMMGRAAQYFDGAGRLVDESWRERLVGVLAALAEWTRLLRVPHRLPQTT